MFQAVLHKIVIVKGDQKPENLLPVPYTENESVHCKYKAERIKTYSLPRLVVRETDSFVT
jgi:hypothetical protein